MKHGDTGVFICPVVWRLGNVKLFGEVFGLPSIINWIGKKPPASVTPKLPVI